MSWTQEHADTFDRADAPDIDTSTMSDGLGAWSKRVGSAVGITTNQASKGVGTAGVYYDSAGAVATSSRCSLVMVNAQSPAPAVTVQSDGSCYFLYPNGNLYKYAAGVGFTQLAVGSGVPADGSVILIEKIGTTLKGYDDGVEIASVTDTTYASGRPGHYSDANGGRADNWTSYSYRNDSGDIAELTTMNWQGLPHQTRSIT